MNQLFTTPAFAGRQQNRMIDQSMQPNMMQPDGQFDMTQLMSYLSSRYPGLTSMQQGQLGQGQVDIANRKQDMVQKAQQQALGGGVLGQEAQQSRGLFGAGRKTNTIF